MNPLLVDTGYSVLRMPSPSVRRPDDLLDRVLEIVGSRAPSRIQAHDAQCCRLARAWFEALAVSAALQQPGPPVWIRQRWNWGPVEWPLHWCRIPQLKTLDCGALAALARAALDATGSETAPIQLIERFDPAAVENWRTVWNGNRTTPQWMWGELVYHEAVGILDGTRLAVWDPTDSDFVEPPAANTYASIQAIRFDNFPAAVTQGACNQAAGIDYSVPYAPVTITALELKWRELSLATGRWVRLAE